jgi:uncharacterized damage-inducible protein DinB
MSLSPAFLDHSRQFLVREYPAKIRLAIAPLSTTQLWWRPNEASNSIGNLMLHLAGNVRQWIVSGLGGAADSRERQAEFGQRDTMEAGDLLERLDAAVSDAGRVLEGMDEAALLRGYTIQGREVTGLYAVYHVVEHFAMHTGQIAWLVKLLTGRDLEFYEDAGGLAVPRWEERAARPE